LGENAATLGILLALLGMVVLGLSLAFVRLLPQVRPLTLAPAEPPVPVELPEHDEAVLLVEAGGRIAYLNPQARAWFRLGEDEPDLERLSRRARPGDLFLALCARQGRARLTVDGRFVEGTSYYVPYGTERAMLVSLSQPQLILQDQPDLAGDGVSVFAELGQAMAEDLDLEHTLTAVLESVERLLPADSIEAGIWNPESRTLKIYRLAGPPGPERRLDLAGTRSGEALGFAGQVIAAGELLQVRENQSGAEDGQRTAYRSFLGAPLLAGGEPFGALWLASLNPGAFGRNEREILRILSGQAAVALHNALLQAEAQRRLNDLVGLNELTRPAESGRDPQVEIARLVELVTPLLGVEKFGFFLYDESRRALAAQRPFTGLPEGMLEWGQVEIPSGSPAEAVLTAGETILAADSAADLRLETLGLQPLIQAAGVRAAALLPLSTGERVLGYLFVADKGDGAPFDADDLRLLNIIAGQASRVIENSQKVSGLQARLARLEERLLAALNETETARKQSQSLLDREQQLTATMQRSERKARWMKDCLRISGLLHRQPDAESVLSVLGRELLASLGLDTVLVVAARSGGPRLLALHGQIPEVVRPEALLGQPSPLLKSLQNHRLILAPSLPPGEERAGSPLLKALEAVGMICLPVVSGERSTQAENLQGTAPARGEYALLGVSRTPLPELDQDDQALFELLSEQASIALDNLSLAADTNRRVEEVRLLLNFTRLLSSAGPFLGDPDEPEAMAKSFQLLAESALHLIPAAQACAVLTWDAVQETLLPRAAAGYREKEPLLEVRHRRQDTPAGRAFMRGEPVRIDEVDFARDYRLAGEDLLRYSAAAGGKLPVSALAVPLRSPQVPEGGAPAISGVLLLENYEQAAAFTPEAEALITSLAQQTALTLENARLYRASEQRARQLEALAQASVVLTATLEPNTLASELLGQLGRVMDFDTGTLWLRQGQKMVVRAVCGFEDNDERTGLTAAVEDSLLLNEMAQTGRPIVVDDIRQDSRFPQLEEHPRLSWLGVPLIAGREVIGVIALEKAEAGYFTAEQVLIAATFAGQAAAAVENASLYAESVARAQALDQRSQRLELLNQLSVELSATLDPNRILNSASQYLLKLVGCTGAAALLFEPEGSVSLRAEAGQEGMLLTGDSLPAFLPPAPLFDRLRESLGIYQAEDAPGDPELAPLAGYLERRGTRSLLALPLVTGNDLHGLLLALTGERHHFSPEEVSLARTIANQAAVGVQNARLYAETRSLSHDLERRVKERTAQLAREHQRTQTLLKVLTELSSSLDLDHVLNRTLGVLNELMDARHISVLIARPGENRLYHLASLGYADVPPSPRRTTDLDPVESLAGWVISNGKAALIDDMTTDPRWVPYAAPEEDEPADRIWERRSVIGAPLMVGAEALGALLFFHPQPGHFSSDQVDLVEAVARQVAVAVNNAELYRLIRDQAEDLGGMLRKEQVETSRTRAILEAVADGVLVTDARRKITVFNASAEEILGLGRGQVIGRSLDDFLGLFGPAGQDWVETIQAWSQDPASYNPGDVFAAQITLENGRVVSVHLAPVQARPQSGPGRRGGRGEFLGTVSIFRDITHQVEVDRLKSEFVATVSHELRTPMTAIKGYIDMLRMGAAGPVSEQQGRFLSTIQGNTERLEALVDDLLDISQIEAGRSVISLGPVDLATLAADRVSEFRRRSEAAGKGLELELAVEPGLPAARGDVERVRQVLDNLLENAFLYTPNGGQVCVRLRQSGNELQVEVQDSGIGISAELQSRVFERFFRGEHPFVLASSGTGLGLAIVKNLVEMQGGRIWLESSGIPGEGSLFAFTLPVLEPGE